MLVKKFVKKNWKDLISIFLTAVIAFATVVGFLSWKAAQLELKEVKLANQGSFILQLNRDFFFNDRLYKIRKSIDSNQPLLSPNGEFTESDLDDYIGTFEMMSILNERGILDEDLVKENFGGFLVDAYKNKEIMNYIKTLRQQYKDSEIYTGFTAWGQEFSK